MSGWSYYATDLLYDVFGVDLSAHNRYDQPPNEYQWNLLGPRCSFMGFRGLWRDQRDPDIFYHMDNVKNRYPDMPVFIYQYMAVKASSTFMKKLFDALRFLVDDLGGLDKIKMGIGFDVESDANPDGLSKQQFGDWLAKYYSWSFSEWGKENILTYTNKNSWARHLGYGDAAYKTDYPKQTKLMVARYKQTIAQPDSDGYDPVPEDWADLTHPPYGYKWIMWQYSADGNKLGNGKTPGLPSFGVHSYSIDLDRFYGNKEDFKRLFGVYPREIELPLKKEGDPPPPPPADPKVIEIANVGAGDRLNVRVTPWGHICAQTWDGEEFGVLGVETDTGGRKWYKIAEDAFVASWYTKVVE